jgi:hypothetical protein
MDARSQSQSLTFSNPFAHPDFLRTRRYICLVCFMDEY